jgi:hypothetical protein
MYGCLVKEPYLSRTVAYVSLQRQDALMRVNEEDWHDWRLFCPYGCSLRDVRGGQLRSGGGRILKMLDIDSLIHKLPISITDKTYSVLMSSIFWDITPCSPWKVNRRFGGTYRLHLQSRRISVARN